jgi:hypothetical protein
MVELAPAAPQRATRIRALAVDHAALELIRQRVPQLDADAALSAAAVSSSCRSAGDHRFFGDAATLMASLDDALAAAVGRRA